MGFRRATETTLADLLRGHARERPDAEALACGERRLTYGQLDARSSQAANALLADGVRPGDRIGFLAKNAPEFYEVAFAAGKAAAAIVGLNWRLAPAELEVILADAEPAVLIVDPEQAAFAQAAGDEYGFRVVVLGDGYEAWVQQAPKDDPEVPSGAQDTILQFYSSGTTGLPKGVMLSNENMSHSETMAREGFHMGPGSTNMVVSPVFHIGGAGYGLMALTQGGRTILIRDPTPEAILDAVERERVTHTFVVPAVIQTLVDTLGHRQRDLSSLQLVSYGGAPMTEPLLRRALDAFGCGFLGVYGMTETAGTVAALAPEDHVPDGDRAGLLRSIGRPLPWLELRVADLVTGEETRPGEVGEIWVRSGQNMTGYWKQPELTAATLVEGGWLRTGDAAHRDEAGHLFLRDRLKDMIISGGENVYPAEVENVLVRHPAVQDVAVIGVAHERWGETVKAVVVLRAGQTADEDGLKAFSRANLARYKCPTSVDFVGELPRNASGKVLKKVLRDAYAADLVGGE